MQLLTDQGSQAGTPPQPQRMAATLITAPGLRAPCQDLGPGHTVIACDCHPSTPPPGFERTSLRAMRRGVEVIGFGARQLRLDEDAFVVVNGGSACTSAYAGEGSVGPVVVVFAPALLAQCVAAADEEDDDARSCPAPCEFIETLQARRGEVAAHLHGIERQLRERSADALWWEERIALLLAALVAANRELQRREAAMPARKPATRRELLRRVLMASDYIQSAYQQPITLHDIAAAARLSRFHLVRLFQRAHGLTPHAYLTRKRVGVARRLLGQTELGLDDIATRSGLGSRSSLFRQLRRLEGSGAAALRAQWMERDPCTFSA